MIIGRAILKYGPEAFTLETLSTHETLAEASDAERTAIRTHGTLSPAGYNVAVGGYNVRGKPGRPSPESIERIASMWRGKKLPPELRLKLSEARRGMKLTAEHRERIGAASRGKPNRGVAIAALTRMDTNGVAGARGVRPTPGGKWMVRIKIKGKTIYVGTYQTVVEASAAYGDARTKRLAELGAHQ